MNTWKNSWMVPTVLFAIGLIWSQDALAQGTLADAKKLQAKIRNTVKQVMPATVSITDGIGFGSGVVVTKDGFILTAGHVISTTPKGRKLTVFFPDGSQAKAESLGMNLNVDAGMAKLIGDEDKEWPYVEVGDSGEVNRGDWCICIGHSGGYELGRTPPVRIGKVLRKNERRLITDCALIGGDSGGPLFDLDGELIGIHSSIANSIAENRHAAINPFLSDWDKLAAGEKWGRLGNVPDGRPVLGIVMDEEEAKITTVVPNSAASSAGLKVGDVVVSIDNTQITGSRELVEAIADRRPGNTIKLTILRNNRTLNISARLKSRAELRKASEENK